ncbi:MAG: hypothetical protein WC241_04760 [Candidatus Paceibacterota bacterium]|jgi:hypothetical protein
MEEIILDKIEWQAPEYKHKDKSVDFIWTIGVVALVMLGLAIWQANYVFAVFIFISGGTLILFSIREPENINFIIETSGLSLGKDKYEWKKIKGFHIKKEETMAILLIEINKYFLPVYTISLPIELVDQVRESLMKVIPNIELEESKSMKFMEKLGF